MKNFFKRNLPKQDKVKLSKRFAEVFGNKINDASLWSLNRHSICRAVFIGVFLLYMPIPGQMLLAAIFAIVFRANLPLCIALVWISNPLTIAPILYAAYMIGCFVLSVPIEHPHLIQGIQGIWDFAKQGWLPLLLGCFLSGFVSASFGYLLVNNLWAWHVKREWKKRQEKRLQNHK